MCCFLQESITRYRGHEFQLFQQGRAVFAAAVLDHLSDEHFLGLRRSAPMNYWTLFYVISSVWNFLVLEWKVYVSKARVSELRDTGVEI